MDLVLNKIVHEGIEVERRNGFRMGNGWRVSLDDNFGISVVENGLWDKGVLDNEEGYCMER